MWKAKATAASVQTLATEASGELKSLLQFPSQGGHKAKGSEAKAHAVHEVDH